MLLRDETWRKRDTNIIDSKNEPNSDVQGVKSNECEIRRAKQIAANREPMLKDQSMPFHGRPGEKHAPSMTVAASHLRNDEHASSAQAPRVRNAR